MVLISGIVVLKYYCHRDGCSLGLLHRLVIYALNGCDTVFLWCRYVKRALICQAGHIAINFANYPFSFKSFGVWWNLDNKTLPETSQGYGELIKMCLQKPLLDSLVATYHSFLISLTPFCSCTQPIVGLLCLAYTSEHILRLVVVLWVCAGNIINMFNAKKRRKIHIHIQHETKSLKNILLWKTNSDQ